MGSRKRLTILPTLFFKSNKMEEKEEHTTFSVLYLTRCKENKKTQKFTITHFFAAVVPYYPESLST